MTHQQLMGLSPVLRDYISYTETVQAKSANTVNEYYTDLRTFFRYIKLMWGLIPADTDFVKIEISDVDIELIKKITLSDVYAFLVFCKNERHNSEKTRARKTSSLRSFFKYLTTKVHLLDTNPVEQLDTPKAKKSLPKYLTLEQSLELLNSIEGEYKERDFCMLVLFLNCGIRLSELCGLNLSDIRDDNTMRVLGKGNKERVVYLNGACIAAIKAYVAVRPVDGVTAQHKKALFLSRLKRRISNKTVQHIVYMRLENAGFGNQGYSVHKLRHTAATLMYQYGNVDIRVLKDILGHENLGTTQIYTHLSNEQIKNAIEANPLSGVKAKKKNKID